MINVLTCIFLLFWLMMAMMSPMAFDAPGSEFHPVLNWPWSLILILFFAPLIAIIMYHQFECSFFSLPSYVIYSIFGLQALLVAAFYGTSFLQALSARGIDGLDREDFARISDKVYFRGSFIPDADAKTFRALPGPYSQDAKHVFTFDRKNYGQIAVLTENVQNFASYPAPYQMYASDGTDVYYGDQKLADMDPASTEFQMNQDKTILTIKSKKASYQKKETGFERITP